MREMASAVAILDQAQALEDVAGGAGGGKPQIGLPLRQPQDQLAGAPVGVLVANLGQGFHDLRTRAPGFARVRSPLSRKPFGHGKTAETVERESDRALGIIRA